MERKQLYNDQNSGGWSKAPTYQCKGKGHPMTCSCKQRYFSNPLATSALEDGEWSAGQAKDMWVPWAGSYFGVLSNRQSLTLFGVGQGWPTIFSARLKCGYLWRYSFTCGNLSLLALHFRLFQRRLSAPYMLRPLQSGPCGQRHPQPIYSREISRTNCTGGRVGLGACLDEQAKFRLHQDSIRRPSSPQPVAIPTTYTTRKAKEYMHKIICAVRV